MHLDPLSGIQGTSTEKLEELPKVLGPFLMTLCKRNTQVKSSESRTKTSRVKN